MKKFKILGLSIMSLLLFAFQCDSDDDVPLELNNANLAGVYNLTEFSGNSEDRDASGNVIGTATYTASNFNNATVTFTEAGTVSSTGSYTLTATFTENGMTDTEVEVENLDINGTYTLSGNNIIFSDNSGETTVIENFNGSSLEIIFNDIETDADGTFEANALMALSRQ